MGFLKNIVKGAIVLGVVGALLAMAAPFIADVIAPLITTAVYDAATHTSIAWTAAFFGAFGAINAAVSPIFDKLLGSNAPSTAVPVANARDAVRAPSPSLALEQEVESRTFRDQEEQRRAGAAAAAATSMQLS